jgi:hypothetical protein
MLGPIADPDVEAELRHRYQEIEQINHDVEDLLRNLTDVELTWTPNPAAWSIAQCLEHLAVTARADLPHIRHALARGHEQRQFGRGPFRYGLFGKLLIAAMDASVRFKFKAPAVYRPGANSAPRESIREFFVRQQEILECIRGANGLHLARVKMTLPSHRRLRLSIGQEFRLLVVHEQRHLEQAKRVWKAMRASVERSLK